MTNFVRAFGAIYALACSLGSQARIRPIWLDSRLLTESAFACCPRLLLFPPLSRSAGGDRQCPSVMLLITIFEVEWPQSCLLPRAA